MSSIFKTLIDQAINDFKSFGIIKGSICVIPGDYQKCLIELLKENIKQLFKEILLPEEANGSDSNGSIVAIIPNSSEITRNICEIFKKYPNFDKTLLIIPIFDRLSQIVVEESGLKDKIDVKEFHAEILLLEDYEFLVPIPNCFKNVYVENNICDLNTIARVLVKIEILNGIFPKVHTFGPMAEKVKHLLQEMKEQISIQAFNEPQLFSDLIIIDRTCDLYTPLLTQFTYEGIIDENLGLNYSILKLPEDFKNQEREIRLNDDDGAFKEIRGMQIQNAIEKVSSNISEIGRAKKSLMPGMDTNQFKIQAMNAKRLAELKPLLTFHLNLMDYLIKLKYQDIDYKKIINFEYDALLGIDANPPYADKYMLLDHNWDEAIRQYCISCLFHRGLSNTSIEKFRRVLYERFGFKILQDIDNLAKSHLVIPKSKIYQYFSQKIPQWERIRNSFHLLTSEEEHDKFDSFYDGGYVPLSCRLVEYLISGTLDHIKKRILRNNNTPYSKSFEFSQIFQNIIPENKNGVRRILVFIIGGAVATELSIIRSMGLKLFDGSTEFFVGTTSILTGKRFVHELCPTIANEIKKQQKTNEESVQ